MRSGKGFLKKLLVLFCAVFLFCFSLESKSTICAANSNGFTVNVKIQGEMISADEFSTKDLASMKQTKQVYSSVDPMPAPSITLAQGVLLTDFLANVNISANDVNSITLSSPDGWKHTYGREILFGTERYHFPDIVTGWDSDSVAPPEFLSGTADNKKSVMPMFAIKSFQERFNPDPDWGGITNADGIRFCFGQKSIEEQSMINYGKNINHIDIELNESSKYVSLDESVNRNSFKAGTTVTLNGIAKGLNSANVTITDPNGTQVVSEEPIAISNGSYIYNFSIDKGAAEGKYKIKISDGVYTADFIINVSKSGNTGDEIEENGENDTTDKDGNVSNDEEQGLSADTLTVKVGYYGGPYVTKKVFSLEELQQLPQVKQAYTFIDSMPAVILDSAVGVRLTDILESSGIDVNSVEAFYFYCTDVTGSWYETLTKPYLLDTKRYYYPNLVRNWNNNTQTASPGAKTGAVEVDTILALEDNWQRFGTKPDYSDLNTENRFRLLFGQTDTGTYTASRSAKWIHAIEVMLGGTPPSGITLDKTSLNLKVGSTYQLTPSVGIVDNTTDKRVTWSSSDPSVVKVDSRGRLKVLSDGIATITATTVVGGKTAACVVNNSEQENDEDSQAVSNPSNDNYDIDTKDGEVETELAQNIHKQVLEKVQEGDESKPIDEPKETTETGVQPWRVYEMSPDAAALPDIKGENIFTPYAGGGAILLFLFGGITRVKKFRNEV